MVSEGSLTSGKELFTGNSHTVKWQPFTSLNQIHNK